MKILKLLNKKNLFNFNKFFIFFSQNSYSEEPVDIWNLDEIPKKKLCMIMIKPKKMKILIKVNFIKHSII